MTIRTERLTIRRIRSGDWESIQGIWDDQKQSVYACYDRPNDTNSEAVKIRVRKWATFENSMEHMFFAVCLDETVIGYVSFNQRPVGYEIRYCFHSLYHGKGYAKESLLALISEIQSLRPCVAITAGTALENIPSVRLLQSLGFRITGTEKVSFFKDAHGKDICFEGGVFELDIQ